VSASHRLLEFDCSARRGDFTLDAAFNVRGAGVTALFGPSGCGKTTTLRLIAGDIGPVRGRIVLDGRVLVDTAARVDLPMERRGIGWVFQDGRLFPHLTVRRNLEYAADLRPDRRGALPDGPAQDRVIDVLGLGKLLQRWPRELSGGERQRVALARALAASPRLLLLDEPLSALDAGLRQRLADDLRPILVESGTTAVMVTHDHEEAFAVADDLAVMRAGRIVQSGPIADVWRAPVDPETALFLGYARVLDGPAAEGLVEAAGLPRAPAVAMRRSALTVADDGPLAGVVVGVRTTPGQLRLVVDTVLGELDAVASLDHRLVPGDAVHLRVDASRMAGLAGRSEGAEPALD